MAKLRNTLLIIASGLILSLENAHAGRDTWIASVQEKGSLLPIQGALVKFSFHDGRGYRSTDPIASCTTNSKGMCVFHTERDDYIDPQDQRWGNVKITASKEGYYSFSMPMTSQSIKNGEAFLTAALYRIPSVSISFQDQSGKPLEGVVVKDFIGNECRTDTSGTCSSQFQRENLVAQKEGFETLNFQVRENSIETLKAIVVTEGERNATEKSEAQPQVDKVIARRKAIEESPTDFLCAAYGNIIRKEALGPYGMFENEDKDEILIQIQKKKNIY